MAEISWVKLTTDMFDNRKIKYLRRLPEGNNIVLIWVMLLTMAGRCNAGGMIFLTENIPYSPKMLADELDFEENTVKLALDALENMGMVATTDRGFFAIAGWHEHQNVDGMEKIREQTRKRVAKHREKQALLEGNVTGNVTETLSNATEKEKKREDIDLEKEKRVKDTPHTLFNRLCFDYIFAMESHAELRQKLEEWITYKTERKESYKEQGMKSLLRQVENNALKHGDQAVCNLIDECMANGWKGIIFDRLTKNNNKPSGRVESNPSWVEEDPAEITRRAIEQAKKFRESMRDDP